DAFRPDLAMSLNNLANRLSELGRREDALAVAEEAVSLYRTLAAQRPDAFRPDLATSLWVLADCLDALARQEEGLAANAEAIGFMAEPFARLPLAFADRMGGMAREYRDRCEKLGQEPDMVLLTPIVETFEQLQAAQENPP
ncbi:MAG: tetratricopeptide repeat protein, partial [Rhodopila sp.]